MSNRLETGDWRPEGGTLSRSRRARPSSFLLPSPLLPFPPSRRSGGFTLIELLITIVVIAILASVMLGALARASTSAKTMATRAQVHKLHNQVMERWESYRTRRLPIDPRSLLVSTHPNNGNVTAGLTAMGVPTPHDASNVRAVAGVRLLALRELMRLEMPQRWEDVTGNMSSYPGPPIKMNPAPGDLGLEILEETPALSRAYLRRYNSQASQPSDTFQAAECLYMIVTMGIEDNSLGTDKISLKDIGDVDGDGMREFLDGWGNPISFLRWAPGFESDLQPDADVNTTAVERDPLNRHDPFDPLKLDTSTTFPYRGFQLFPLIYSGGPDGAQDIWAANAGLSPAELNDPYHDPGASGMPAGTPMTPTSSQPGEGRHTDNIHNHLLTTG